MIVYSRRYTNCDMYPAERNRFKVFQVQDILINRNCETNSTLSIFLKFKDTCISKSGVS